MDEINQSMETKEPAKIEQKHNSLRILALVLAVLILMGASAGIAYWWRGKSAVNFEAEQAADIVQLQKDKINLQKQLASATTSTTTSSSSNSPAACTAKAPDANTIANIEASITSKNTAALQGYMASSVTDVYAASDTIPAKTPADSVADISTFVTDQITGDWSFPVAASTVSSYKQGSYAQYFPSTAVVGSSTRHRVISFLFDCNAKISTVFMAADDAVLM